MDTTIALGPGNRGPRACVTCAKAKSRCIPGPDTIKCERCHRLGKSCSSQTPAPPRPRKKPRPTRVAELEERLAQLTSRLDTARPWEEPASTPVIPEENENYLPRYSIKVPNRYKHLFPGSEILDAEPITASQSPEFAAESSSPGDHSLASTQNGGDQDAFSSSEPRTMSSTAATSPDNTVQSRPESLGQTPGTAPTLAPWPEGKMADEFLDQYREDVCPLFPFAIIPPDMTSAQLRAQRPFLWKAVMVGACRMDGPRQFTLGELLLKELVLAAYTEPERSLDLLQSLQITLVWHVFSLKSFQVINLAFLCRSICLGLGITESQTGPNQDVYTSSCLEQMRAFAGTYYLLTVIFTTNKKADALMNTSYLETCCRVLESKMEYPTDELLVWLVRSQQLAQSISMTLAMRNNNNLQAAELPLHIVIKSFGQQLDTFQASLPQHMRENMAVMSHVHVTELLLYEVALLPSSGLSITDQLQALWACVIAAKGFFSYHRKMQNDRLTRFVCTGPFHVVYADLIGLKLVNFNAPGWDKRLVLRELEFDRLLAWQAQSMEDMATQRAAAGQSPESDPIHRMACKLRCVSRLLAVEAAMPDVVYCMGAEGTPVSPPPSTPQLTGLVPSGAAASAHVGEDFPMHDAADMLVRDLDLFWDALGTQDWDTGGGAGYNLPLGA